MFDPSGRPELRDLLQAEATRQQADLVPPFAGLQRRATRRRQRSLGGAVVALALVVAVPFAASRSGGHSHGPASSPVPSASPSVNAGVGQVPSFLSPVGLELSRRNGDPAPTQIQAVAVDDGALAERSLLGSTTDGTSHVGGWVIEAQGAFSCIDCSTAGAQGSVLVGFYNPDDEEFESVAVTDHWTDLHTLGGALALPTTDAASGKLVTVAQAKATALLESSDATHASVVWTRELTAAQLAAQSSDPLAHIGLAPTTRLIVVAVEGKLGFTQPIASRYAVIFTVNGTGPRTSSMECVDSFCGLTAGQ